MHSSTTVRISSCIITEFDLEYCLREYLPGSVLSDVYKVGSKDGEVDGAESKSSIVGVQKLDRRPGQLTGHMR